MERSLQRREEHSQKVVGNCVLSSLFTFCVRMVVQKASKRFQRCDGWRGEILILRDERQNHDIIGVHIDGCRNDLAHKILMREG